MHTINGKEHTEFDINKRCAEIMGEFDLINEFIRSRNAMNKRLGVGKALCLSDIYNPYQNPSDTWSIIEKVWDELNELVDEKGDIATIGTVLRFEKTKFNWQRLIEKHNCTKLVAACICLIEVNEGI